MVTEQTVTESFTGRRTTGFFSLDRLSKMPVIKGIQKESILRLRLIKHAGKIVNKGPVREWNPGPLTLSENHATRPTGQS